MAPQAGCGHGHACGHAASSSSQHASAPASAPSQVPASKVIVVEEEDPRWQSVYGAKQDSTAHALYSAIVTLTLGVLGSTILPVPYAFSKMGVASGVATMAVVAYVNRATCCMLVRAAGATGRYSYEELAEWAGGKKARAVTQVSLVLLLYGTLCGGLAFLSDVSRILVLKGLMPLCAAAAAGGGESTAAAAAAGAGALLDGAADATEGNSASGVGGGSAGSGITCGGIPLPDLLQRDGRPLMILVVAAVLYPLCLQRHIRQFERAATVGVVVVVALMALIIGRAAATGFPGIADGEVPLLELRLDAHTPEAFAVLGFAFYMQPMLMPLLKEMPRGPSGMRVSERAVNLVLYGVACAAYGTVGVFGASIFGQSTESNIMVNDLLPGHPGWLLLLYAALLVYLCCGMVTTHYALRASVDAALFGPHAPFTWWRQVCETTCILLAAMAVAVAFPTQAEKIFAFTGCTAVCVVCYCVPVYIHMRLLRAARDAGLHRAGSGLHLHGLSGLMGDRSPADTSVGSVEGVGGQAAPAGSEGYHGSAVDGEAGNGDGLREPLLPGNEGSAGDGDDGEGDGAAEVEARAAALAARVRCMHEADGPESLAARARELALPALVVAVGVGCSLAGLYVAALDVMG